MLRRLALSLAALTLVLAACGSATPALSDPKEIVTTGIEATTGATAFHMSAEVSGTVTIPDSGGTFALDGTHLDADFDLEAGSFHMTFAIPALLGFTGEVVQIGTDQYVKSSLTGPKWQHTEVAATDPVGEVTDPTAVLDTVKDFLDKEGVETKKLDDSECGGASCYHVELTIPADQLGSAADATGGVVSADMFGDGLVLDLYFTKSDNRLAQITTGVDSESVGSLTVTITFSAWDEDVSIDAPPADEVEEGDAFSL